MNLNISFHGILHNNITEYFIVQKQTTISKYITDSDKWIQSWPNTSLRFLWAIERWMQRTTDRTNKPKKNRPYKQAKKESTCWILNRPCKHTVEIWLTVLEKRLGEVQVPHPLSPTAQIYLTCYLCKSFPMLSLMYKQSPVISIHSWIMQS